MEDVMQTPCPPVSVVAWCQTCEHYIDDGQAGQRCPVRDPDCYSILVKRRVLVCGIPGYCAEVKMAILAPAGQPVRDVWRIHLMEEHAG